MVRLAPTGSAWCSTADGCSGCSRSQDGARCSCAWRVSRVTIVPVLPLRPGAGLVGRIRARVRLVAASSHARVCHAGVLVCLYRFGDSMVASSSPFLHDQGLTKETIALMKAFARQGSGSVARRSLSASAAARWLRVARRRASCSMSAPRDLAASRCCGPAWPDLLGGMATVPYSR